ncbi:MAG: DUF1905 domain-containing protein [Bacteroidota bacterium]
MQAKITYDFSGKLWRYAGKGGWYFVSLPSEISKEIRANMKWQEEGWGRMKATATVGGVECETAIWFDKQRAVYLLPIKADVRKKAKLELDQIVFVSISI